MTKLYVCAGHGGKPYDPGATAGGYTEADLVRQLAERLKALGGSNVEVLDTSRNWYADGGVNAALKKKVGSNPVIELHMDSAGSSAKGGHVIISDKLSADKYDKALAANIAKMFPGRAESIVKRGDLANINRDKTQSINYRLLECCFISNSGDREKFIGSMSDVAKTILDAFGIGSKTLRYRVLKNNLYVWDKPQKGARHLTELKKGRIMDVTETLKADGLLWGGFTAKATGKTRYFKIGTTDGKTVYAEKL